MSERTATIRRPPQTDESPPGTLYTRTRDLLGASPETILEVHKNSGVPFHWLARFKCGQIRNPSVNTVQRLYEYLTGKPLKL